MNREIKSSVYYVGVNETSRKFFDELVPLPEGTSYNAYLVEGSEKVALIDTVYPPKFNEYMDILNNIGVKNVDYIISNHSEQDHSGCIPQLLEIYPDAMVVTNKKCKELIMDALLVDESKFIVVDTGDTISLGDKTLEFTMAPWVHWPDTMFTYLKEDNILFTCDFMGSHQTLSELFVTDEKFTYEAAKRYYAEIMMPFRKLFVKYLDLIETIEPSIIATSHGPLYNRPEFILDAYKDWASERVSNKVIIPYVTMYGNTQLMVEKLEKQLIEADIEVTKYNVMDMDLGELTCDVVDCATIVVASPIFLAGVHPNLVSILYLINAIKPKTKFLSLIGSSGWGGMMVEQVKGFLSNFKAAEFIEPVIIKGTLKGDDFTNLDRLASDIIERHKAL